MKINYLVLSLIMLGSGSSICSSDQQSISVFEYYKPRKIIHNPIEKSLTSGVCFALSWTAALLWYDKYFGYVSYRSNLEKIKEIG